jgi:hypothetical protein
MNATERLKRIQEHQLNARIDWLTDHLNRLGDDPAMKPALRGWRFELREKQLMLHELKAGKMIDDRAVRSGFDAAGALRRAHRALFGHREVRISEK